MKFLQSILSGLSDTRLTLSEFAFICVSTLALALIVDRARYRWPPARRIAIATIGMMTLYVAVSMLIGSIQDARSGISAYRNIHGSGVELYRQRDPLLFWFYKVLQIVVCLMLAFCGAWATLQSLLGKKREVPATTASTTGE